MATERIQNKDGSPTHPTQKPVQLIQKLLQVEPQITLDPFLGSGTTLRACKDLGRRGIGIEIDEKYCEIAAQRLKKECFGLAGGEIVRKDSKKQTGFNLTVDE